MRQRQASGQRRRGLLTKGPPNRAHPSAERAAAASELNQFSLESVLRSSSHISSELVCFASARAAVRGTKQVRCRPVLHPNAEKAQTPASPAVPNARAAVFGGQGDLVVLDLPAVGLGRFGPRCPRWGNWAVEASLPSPVGLGRCRPRCRRTGDLEWWRPRCRRWWDWAGGGVAGVALGRGRPRSGLLGCRTTTPPPNKAPCG